MPELPLPIWIIRPREVKSPPANEPCDEPGHVVAFAETQHAIKFMSAREAGEWQMHLLTDPDTLILLVADLHHKGVPAICLNPEPDGSKGEKVPITDLIVQAERDRTPGSWVAKPPKP